MVVIAARAADIAMGVRVIESEQPAAVTDAVGRAMEQGGALIVVAFDRTGRLLAASIGSRLVIWDSGSP